MPIDQLPAIVREAARGLSNANVSVLNGADGLGEIAAGLVGQGLTIFDAQRSSMPGASEVARGTGGEPSPNGDGTGVGELDAAGDNGSSTDTR